MKELLLSYAAYNLWANDLMGAVIRPLPEETLRRELVSSFPSLRATLLHLLDAENIWWQRVHLQEKIVRPSELFEGDGPALVQAIHKQNTQWLEFVQKSNEHVFTHEFIYLDQKRNQHKSQVGQVLHHIFNHGTYHRGQLVTMLRQLGTTTIPSTDFIAWTRKK